MDKVLYDASDIAADLSVSHADAEGLLNELCMRMEKKRAVCDKRENPKSIL